MALNTSLSYFIVLLVFFSIAQAKRDVPKYAKKTSSEFMNSSAFGFINHLKGCHKGSHSKDIHRLKNYLHQFGYLDQNQSVSNNDDFDDSVEAAVKTYQSNFHLNPTGTVDEETVATMMRPRCGVADIVNGTNFIHARTKKEPGLSHFHTVAHYTFFEGRPKWDQTTLTYGFLPDVPLEVRGPVARAFARWDSATIFTFSEAPRDSNANMVIGWFSGKHSDDIRHRPFDGPGGALAHANSPPGGMFHYDADEAWSVEPQAGRIHYETVALHEIGHLLGLHHNTDSRAIMAPSISPGETKGLTDDDINGIGELYRNVNA